MCKPFQLSNHVILLKIIVSRMCNGIWNRILLQYTLWSGDGMFTRMFGWVLSDEGGEEGPFGQATYCSKAGTNAHSLKCL